MSLFPYGYVGGGSSQGPPGPRGIPGVQGSTGPTGVTGPKGDPGSGAFDGSYTGNVDFHSEQFNINDISTSQGACFNVMDDQGNSIISALNQMDFTGNRLNVMITQTTVINGISYINPSQSHYPLPDGMPSFTVLDIAGITPLLEVSDATARMNISDGSASINMSANEVSVQGGTVIKNSAGNDKPLEVKSSDNESRLEVNELTNEIYLGYDLMRRVAECDIGSPIGAFTNIYGTNGYFNTIDTVDNSTLFLNSSNITGGDPLKARFNYNSDMGSFTIQGSNVNPNTSINVLDVQNGAYSPFFICNSRLNTPSNLYSDVVKVNNASFIVGGTGTYFAADLGGVFIGNVLLPNNNIDIDVGSTSLRFRSIYLVNQPNVSSSRDIKDDIEPLTYGLDYLKKLQPKQYVLKADEHKEHHWGFVVEDVATCTPKETAFLQEGGLQYCELLAPLVKSVQELDTKIEAMKCVKTTTLSPTMKTRIDGIERNQQDIVGQLASLSARMAMLETRIKSLDPETRSLS